MKKTMIKSVGVTSLALLAALAVADPLRVTVNGQPVDFEAAQPTMVGERVLVPLRGVFEAIGATVDWNKDTQSVVAFGDGRHVRLRIGSRDADVDGRIVTMDVAPQIIQDSTMVPLRFLSESLGASVDWRPEEDLVAIVAHPRMSAEHFGPPAAPPPPPVVMTPPPPPQTVIIERPAPTPAPTPAPPPPPPPPVTIDRDTVIALRLDQELTSNHAAPGEVVEARVTGGMGRHMEFPDGTVLVGRVMEARSADGSHGGVLKVRFSHLKFPDGATYAISGVVTDRNNASITRTDDGKLIANGRAERIVMRDASPKGAPLELGFGRDKVEGGSAVGGTVGQIFGIFDNRIGRNVIIPAGQPLALILADDLTIERHDMRHDR